MINLNESVSGNALSVVDRVIYEQLKAARSDAQAVITKSEQEAKDIVSSEINQARKDAANLIARTNRELDTQKSMALEKLETQIEELSQQITEKLLGKESVL